MIKTIYQKLKNWVTSHGGVTHLVAGIYTSLYFFYEDNTEVQNYIRDTALTIYHSLPHWLSSLLAGLIIPLFLWYWRKLSRSGKIQAAEQVKK